MSEVLSPGVANGCFELLDLIYESPMQLTAARGLGKLGVIPAHRVTSCALTLGWAEVNADGALVVTERGVAVRDLPLTADRLRRAILDIIEVTDPPWVQNARFGRRKFLRYAPPEIAQLCHEAGLIEGSSDVIVAFWDSLAARARGLHDVQLNEVGRKGERLTIAYETRRTGVQPKWIALESNEDGYDVLSRVGAHDSSRLCIEVKASNLGLAGDFFLTRNEWETAQALVNFELHLWDVADASPKLAVLSIGVLAGHMPLNQGAGAWQVAKVPFATFADAFVAVDESLLGSQARG